MSEKSVRQKAGREQIIRLQITIPAHRYLAYYKGEANTVVARASDGRVIHLPAEVLRPLLNHEGIDGEFILRIDGNDKFVSLVPVS
ncbi:MAG: DUF2835 domain-containing protein [Gammaproteobacteria bacterium]|nr:DUF2835 domain-containing protein [Gammaproteobacteria bacterium]